ncbi:hypothetical protein JRO89_XS07G0193700 [Xanthoceras sorbifolium]|uniref:Retrotransposon Copia-like N-terminal domain-containing protein n=1 Tax=Xanthoceras sorbifolium TaxID=99658 RepID=A0ABQ8HUJ3_9ROSI|nr:hypothetical protein JRO89_XS07G0193700 [Xanthoceras sorbifolium]
MYIRGEGKTDYLLVDLATPEETNPGYKRWMTKNNMIMSWLVNSMIIEIGENFLLYCTAKEIWDAAKETYSNKNNSSELMAIEGVLHDLWQGDSNNATAEKESRGHIAAHADSGMSLSREELDALRKLLQPQTLVIRSGSLAQSDGSLSKVARTGTLVLQGGLILHHVLFVPKLNCCLLSDLDSRKMISNAKGQAGLYSLHVQPSSPKSMAMSAPSLHESNSSVANASHSETRTDGDRAIMIQFLFIKEERKNRKRMKL